MKIDIVNFAEEEGKKISDSLLSKHTEYPHLLIEAKKPIKGIIADIKKGSLKRKRLEKW